MNELTTNTPARIVLVEDDVALARSTRRLLSDLGEVNVETYFDVQSARRALEREFDVLVSDFNLPDGTGVDVLSAGASTTATAPRILITGNTEWDSAARSINEGGAFRVLGKPCSDELLLATVGHALAVKRQNDARAREEAALQRHHLEIAAANADLFISSLGRSREMAELRHRVVKALSRAVDRRFGDYYPKVNRVATMARAFAAHIGLTGEDLLTIEQGILMHRIGSIALRDCENPAQIPDIGAEILGEMGMPSPVIRVVADCGERFNGEGLHGRQGVGIAIGARILAIVLRYVEKLGDRNEREAHEEVSLELLGDDDLDPELVASFVVERAGTFAAAPTNTIPFTPCLLDS